jgi:hypothetical protein
MPPRRMTDDERDRANEDAYNYSDPDNPNTEDYDNDDQEQDDEDDCSEGCDAGPGADQQVQVDDAAFTDCTVPAQPSHEVNVHHACVQSQWIYWQDTR